MSSRQKRLDAYEAARQYIDVELVRLTPRRKAPKEKVETALAFNRDLGDPQRAFPSIQVAGTSGKGSVCALLAATLSTAGQSTGLHVSPYLQVFTEKTWIDGALCSIETLTAATRAITPVAERYRADLEGPASVHGMASLGASYAAFRDAGVDLAVMETGVGGRFDLVQGLDRTLSVITDLGLDHPQALGATLEEVAWHKAGIIEAGVPCVAIQGPGWSVLEDEARRVGAELIPVDPQAVVRSQRIADGETHATLRLPTLGDVDVVLPGTAPFQLRNASLAAMALDRLAADGRSMSGEAIRSGFRERVLPGRFERIDADPRVVLDGAHNPQKLAALRAALGDGRLSVVLAATGQRAPAALLEGLASSAEHLYVCELDLYGKSVVPAVDLAEAATAAGVPSTVAQSPEDALDSALDAAGPTGQVLVTGSLYLLGKLRNRWYPNEEVLLQQTSWPQHA